MVHNSLNFSFGNNSLMYRSCWQNFLQITPKMLGLIFFCFRSEYDITLQRDNTRICINIVFVYEFSSLNNIALIKFKIRKALRVVFTVSREVVCKFFGSFFILISLVGLVMVGVGKAFILLMSRQTCWISL